MSTLSRPTSSHKQRPQQQAKDIPGSSCIRIYRHWSAYSTLVCATDAQFHPPMVQIFPANDDGSRLPVPRKLWVDNSRNTTCRGKRMAILVRHVDRFFQSSGLRKWKVLFFVANQSTCLPWNLRRYLLVDAENGSSRQQHSGRRRGKLRGPIPRGWRMPPEEFVR